MKNEIKCKSCNSFCNQKCFFDLSDEVYPNFTYKTPYYKTPYYRSSYTYTDNTTSPYIYTLTNTTGYTTRGFNYDYYPQGTTTYYPYGTTIYYRY